jgi:hypothetical protein
MMRDLTRTRAAVDREQALRDAELVRVDVLLRPIVEQC